MRRLLFILFFFHLCFSSYLIPPTEEILSFNLAHSNLLADNTPDGIYPTKIDPIPYSNMGLVLVSPSVDDRISYKTNYLFLTYGFLFYTEGNSHGCPLDFQNQLIEYTITFLFQNQTRSISGSYASSASIPTTFQIPFTSQELSTANANDSLLISLLWHHTVTYSKYIEYNGSCIYSGDASYQSSGANFLSYIVEGEKTIDFLSRPILKSQWFRNNHFDFLVFSNKNFYRAQIKRNGQETSNFLLYSFEVNTDSFGLKKISSNYLPNESYSQLNQITNPYPLQMENKTYSFIYSFNSTYEGYGKDNFSVIMTDFFSNEYLFDYEILSRINTYDGTYSEFGQAANMDDETYIPSQKYSYDNIIFFSIPLSFLGVILIFVFLKFKYN
ncbi:MAG: hypothetical protein WC501_00780 [Candidatus Micrarchaeia archaeon]